MINYSQIQNCVETTAKSILYVLDTEDGLSMLVESKPWHVEILNKNEIDLRFIQIDKCVNLENKEQRCDFAIASSETIYFVEVKTFKKPSRKNNKRKEAKKQLAESINYFKNLGLKNMTSTFAVMALASSNVEKYNTHIIEAKGQVEIEMFRLKCGCPNLVEGNHIKF